MPENYTYKFTPAAVGILAEIYSPEGKKLAEAIGFGKSDAKRQVKIAAGIETRRQEIHKSNNKSTKPKKKKRIHEAKGSLMTGLIHKTGARDWKKTK